MTGHPLLQLERTYHRIRVEQATFKLTCPVFDRCAYCAGIAVFHFDQWVHTCGKPACMARAQEHIRKEFEAKAKRLEALEEYREKQRQKKQVQAFVCGFCKDGHCETCKVLQGEGHYYFKKCECPHDKEAGR